MSTDPHEATDWTQLPKWFFRCDPDGDEHTRNKWHILGPRYRRDSDFLIAFCGHQAENEMDASYAESKDYDLFESNICKHCLRMWRKTLKESSA